MKPPKGYRKVTQKVRLTIVVCCIRVGHEIHIGQKYCCNRMRIDTICLCFSETQTFPVKIRVQWIDDIGGQTFVKKESQYVLAVMSGSLKSYFYVIVWARDILDSLV